MINPMQMLQGMNPQQFIQKMMSNNQIMSNPMAKNAINMAQRNDVSGLENMARNLCKEKGLNADDVMQQIKSRFGM